MPCAPSFCKARRLARKPAELSSWRYGVVYPSYLHCVGSAGPKAISESESDAVFQGFMYHRQPRSAMVSRSRSQLTHLSQHLLQNFSYFRFAQRQERTKLTPQDPNES